MQSICMPNTLSPTHLITGATGSHNRLAVYDSIQIPSYRYAIYYHKMASLLYNRKMLYLVKAFRKICDLKTVYFMI